MSFQESVAVRNGRLDSISTTIGTSPELKIRSGSPPADCAAADSGTVLATLALPSPWLASASSGSASMTGTWEDTSADATGTAGHFRIYDSGGTCHLQGTVTATGGGGDLTLNVTSVTAGDYVIITAFTLTAGNA